MCIKMLKTTESSLYIKVKGIDRSFIFTSSGACTGRKRDTNYTDQLYVHEGIRRIELLSFFFFANKR